MLYKAVDGKILGLPFTDPTLANRKGDMVDKVAPSIGATRALHQHNSEMSISG